jgi:hypothetical protein
MGAPTLVQRRGPNIESGSGFATPISNLVNIESGSGFANLVNIESGSGFANLVRVSSSSGFVPGFVPGFAGFAVSPAAVYDRLHSHCNCKQLVAQR